MSELKNKILQELEFTLSMKTAEGKELLNQLASLPAKRANEVRVRVNIVNKQIDWTKEMLLKYGRK